MIKINNKFEISRDKHGWQLHEWKDGLNKDKEPTRTKRTTYHPNLIQICDVVIDREAGCANTMEEVLKRIAFAHMDLEKMIRSMK